MISRFLSRSTSVLTSCLLICSGSSRLVADTNTVPVKPAPAAAVPTTKKTAEKTEKKSKEGAPYPFHGTISSIDKKAMTVSLEGKEHTRVVHLNAESHLEKGGKPATLGDLAVGDYLHGRVEKKGGAEFVVKATAGPKPEKKPAPADAPAKKKKTTADL